MVNLQIITKDEQTAHEIIDHLLKERFVLEGILLENVTRKRVIDEEIVAENGFLIKALAKALLFKSINQYIQDHFGDRDVVMYTIPIVDMDWDAQQSLIASTKTV
jgi:hypothetical protein